MAAVAALVEILLLFRGAKAPPEAPLPRGENIREDVLASPGLNFIEAAKVPGVALSNMLNRKTS